MSQENVEIVRAIVDHWNAGVRSVLTEYLDPAVELESPFSSVSGEPYRGHAGIEQWVRDVDEQFAEWQIDLDDVRELGNTVFATASIHGRGRASGIAFDFSPYADQVASAQVTAAKFIARYEQAGMPAENRDNTTPTVFFKLTFAPGTHAATLTRLSVPGPIHSLFGMAVSPDGTKLALDLGLKSVQVVTLATGTVRSWAWHGSGNIGNWKPMGQVLSWSADGRYLEFQRWGGSSDETMHIRILDTTAPGTSLTAAKVIVAYPYRSGGGTYATGNSFLTPDGTRIVTATTFDPGRRDPAGGYGQITGYSARTGKPVFHEDRFSASAGWQEVLWAGPHGNALVVSDPRGRKTRYGPRANVLGVLAGNKFTPIPHSAYLGPFLAW